MFIIPSLFFLCFLSFLMKIKAPLKMLLAIEFLSISLVILLCVSLDWGLSFSLMIFLVILVTEGAFGLTIFVSKTLTDISVTQKTANFLW